MTEDPADKSTIAPAIETAPEPRSKKKPRSAQLDDRPREQEPRAEIAVQPTAAECQAPFPAGTRLRFAGSDLLLYGWEGHQILGPGSVLRVVEVLERYSVVELPIAGIRVLIAHANRADWIALGD